MFLEDFKCMSDITGMFTPTLKQLFLLILLSGIRNEQGISSIKLTEILWYDKTENRARNNVAFPGRVSE